MIDYQHILKNGVTIRSSGTSGEPKDIFQSPDKLAAANKVAVMAQHIDKDSRVYTCCKISHAGGLLAQTLPALSIGAEVIIDTFNAYKFVQSIRNFSHTHITPLHARAIMLTKGFWDLDLSNLWVTCGADPVPWNVIEAFVERGAIFMTNWGMSEVGPIAINTVFDNLAKVKKYKNICPDNSSILGDNKWCNYKIVDHELCVNGDICVNDGWYATKDRVTEINGILFYQGRTNKEIDLWTPIKG
jgi:acyl-coenzyme A synthetase/AMP-(fatty) acid ligase